MLKAVFVALMFLQYLAVPVMLLYFAGILDTPLCTFFYVKIIIIIEIIFQKNVMITPPSAVPHCSPKLTAAHDDKGPTLSSSIVLDLTDGNKGSINCKVRFTGTSLD